MIVPEPLLWDLVRPRRAIHRLRRLGQLRRREPRRDGDEVGLVLITICMVPTAAALYVLTARRSESENVDGRASANAPTACLLAL
jgi:hypothetical protein